jgi:hypothetical protein
MSRVAHDQVRELTALLRSSQDPLWSRLRDLLSERGVEPGGAVLAECFPDDTSFEFGVVVTAAGSVFQFGFDYLNKQIAEGIFSEWEDLTSRFRSTPHSASIEEALKVIRGEPTDAGASER